MDVTKYQQFYNRLVQNGQNETADAELIPCGPLSVAEAIEIYQNGYSARLTDLLKTKFENVLKAMGDDDFYQLCALYIAENPSKTTNITNYGENFPEFIASLQISQMFPYLKDLATYDQLSTELHHEKTEQGISAEDLIPLVTKALEHNQDPKDRQFVSSIKAFESKYDIIKMINELKEKKDLTPQEASKYQLVIYKTESKVETKTFSANYPFINLKNKNFSFTELFTNLQEQEVSTLFSFLSQNQLLK